MTLVVKNPPTSEGRRCKLQKIMTVGRKDPLEKGFATHSSNLAWRFPRTEEPGGLQYIASQRAGHN